MKSIKLRKLIAGVAMLAITASFVVPGVRANAQIVSPNKTYDETWALNQVNEIRAAATINVADLAKIASDATERKEDIISIERVRTGAIKSTTSVEKMFVSGTNDYVTYDRNYSEGGYASIGVNFAGDVSDQLSSFISAAVSEHKRNVNTVNANRHEQGVAIESTKQDALAAQILKVLGIDKNREARFIVEYVDENGSNRATTVSFEDNVSLERVNTNPNTINSVEDLNALVDENGLVYLTLRGLPTGVNITRIELDSRRPLYAATGRSETDSKIVNKYSVQTNVNYAGGNIDIPQSTWILTDSLYPEVGGNIQFEGSTSGERGVIEKGEHVFVNVKGSSIVFEDLFSDEDKVIKSIEFVDRRGDTYNTTVGDLGTVAGVSGKYVDVSVNGLSPNTNYEFKEMLVTYVIDGKERTQRVSFNNSAVTGKVTGNDYLAVRTSNEQASQIDAFAGMGPYLTQALVGRDKLTYLVKVNDTTNFEKIDVRGLRGGEEFKVTRVKDAEGKKDSNWFAVEIFNLDEERDYGFLSLEVVYDDAGRTKYSIPVSLGRSTSDLTSVLFPSNNFPTGISDNFFTKTTKSYDSEVWVDSNLTAEEIPGGVRLVGRVKDADNALEGVKVSVQRSGRYEQLDDSQVNFKVSYRQTKGMDVNSDGDSRDGNVKIEYPFIKSVGTDETVQNGVIVANEGTVESASKMVEIEITGLDSSRTEDFRVEFKTRNDGQTVGAIKIGEVGALGAIPTGKTKNQPEITRFTSGRVGSTKIVAVNKNVKVDDITATTANVTADIKNPEKEGIAVTVKGTGVSNVTAKYDPATNKIKLIGLTSNTKYTDMDLELAFGGKKVTLDVPEFTTKELGTEIEGGVAGYVNRAYKSFFNRDADFDGLMYWVNGLTDKSITLSYFLEQIAYTPELLERKLTQKDFVSALYTMVDRKPEEEGLNFWVAEIEKGMKDGLSESNARHAVIARMIQTPEVKEIATRLGIKFE